MSSYAAELTFARDLAIAAGEILVRHFGTGLAVELKGWADPVTAADRESERLIVDAIRRRFPADGIFGEELGRHEGTSGRVWIVDPLDGTVNFAGGLPTFSVVIALVEQSEADQAVLNVTYDPMQRELFHAVRGAGAFLDDRAIHVRPCEDLGRALVHLGYSRDRVKWAASVELARRVTAVAPHARNIGSTALAQAYVAAGRLGAHLKVESGDFDVIGGNLLVAEAGGVVTDLDGNPWRGGGSLLAAGPELHALLLPFAAGLDAGGANQQ